MGRTERLELRLDEGLAERIDDWMAEAGIASRSEAVRQLVDIGLGSKTGKSIHLTDGDKLNFMMLRDIMNHFKIKGETDAEFVSQSIYGGHYWAPVWVMNGLFHKHSDRLAEVRLVVDVLDMWDFMEARIDKATPNEVERLKAANFGVLPQFCGFDGNHETTLMSIAEFLVEEMARFSRFKGRDFNSHSPNAECYGRMAKLFDTKIRPELGFGRSITIDQIIELLELDR